MKAKFRDTIIVAIAAVLAALPNYPLAEIRFVLFSARDYEIYRRLLAAAERLQQL